MHSATKQLIKEIFVLTAVVGLLITIVFGGFVGCAAAAGDGSWGFGEDERAVEVLVNDKHEDHAQNSGSSYMVGTDQGTYEVDNGFILGMWDADEVYGSIKVGGRYRFTVQGSTTASWWTQTYPYITKVEELEE